MKDTTTCPNCDSSNVEFYCATCGQKAGRLDIPLRKVIGEAVKRLFAFDSRNWNTLVLLIRRPGQLTVDYLVGKRARYVAPIRLYLFISFVAFLLLSVTSDPISVQSDDDTAAPTDTTGTASDETGHRTVLDSTRVQLPIDSSDSTEISDTASVDTGIIWLDQLLQRIIDDPDGSIRSAYVRRLPWVFFFAMPIFASVLRFLYRRHELYYVPHLIFTLHAYSAGFLIFTIGTGLDALSGQSIFSALALLGIAYHLYLSLRRVYRQGHVSTLAKQVCLLAAHFFVATVGTIVIMLSAAAIT